MRQISASGLRRHIGVTTHLVGPCSHTRKGAGGSLEIRRLRPRRKGAPGREQRRPPDPEGSRGRERRGWRAARAARQLGYRETFSGHKAAIFTLSVDDRASAVVTTGALYPLCRAHPHRIPNLSALRLPRPPFRPGLVCLLLSRLPILPRRPLNSQPSRARAVSLNQQSDAV